MPVVPTPEEVLDHVTLELAAGAERVLLVQVAAVAGADLEDGLNLRVVCGLVGAGPADVMRYTESLRTAERAHEPAAFGYVVAGHDRVTCARGVDDLVPGTRVRAPGPLVGQERHEAAFVVVPIRDGLEVLPLTGSDALAEERLVVGERREVVAVGVARTQIRLVRRAAAVAVRRMLMNVAKERDEAARGRGVGAFGSGGHVPVRLCVDVNRRRLEWLEPRCASGRRRQRREDDTFALAARGQRAFTDDERRDPPTSTTPRAIRQRNARPAAARVEVLPVKTVRPAPEKRDGAGGLRRHTMRSPLSMRLQTKCSLRAHVQGLLRRQWLSEWVLPRVPCRA